MSYDSARRVALLVHAAEYQGTWLWSGNAWSQPATDTYPPGPAMMTFDRDRGVAVVHQPSRDPSGSGDTWEWDGLSWRRVSREGPESRYDGAMVYDAARQRTLLYGGKFSALSCPWPPYTWEWDGIQWRVVDDNGPPRRGGCAMAYDAKHGLVVLFGGRDCDQMLLGSTWTWDGEDWTLAATSGPLARTGHGMVYDEVREKVLLFGGYNEQSTIDNGVDGLNDVWEWNGTTWTEIASVGPSRRYDFAMCYDAASKMNVIFGGWRRNETGHPVLLNDTWLLDRPSLWVDYMYTGVTETGDFTTPFKMLADAVDQAQPLTIVRLKPGRGFENLTLTKPLYLEAPLGTITIGQ